MKFMGQSQLINRVITFTWLAQVFLGLKVKRKKGPGRVTNIMKNYTTHQDEESYSGKYFTFFWKRGSEEIGRASWLCNTDQSQSLPLSPGTSFHGHSAESALRNGADTNQKAIRPHPKETAIKNFCRTATRFTHTWMQYIKIYLLQWNSKI